MDVVREIIGFNAGRDPERLRLKYSHMRADPFVFLRGTCHLFYARLPGGGVFRSAPAVWSCGDLHLENFGSYKGDNRLAYFDLNDFDEGVLAPASWDLVRLLTSVHVGAGTLALKSAAAQSLCETFLDAYRLALLAGKAYWVDPRTADGLVQKLLEGLRLRQREAFLDARTLTRHGHRRLRTDGRKALPVTDEQRDRVAKFMVDFAATQPNPGFYRTLDVARRIAGTGSLGVERYAILVEGKGSPGGNYLLDLKQSLPSSLTPRLKTAQPAWASEAHRVVAVQRRMQAVSMAFLHPVAIGKTPYVLRGLQASEDRVTLDGARQSLGEIAEVIATMGRAVAWAQLRSSGRQGSASADELIDFAEGRKWREKLLAAAEAMAVRTRQDAATFAAAYDDGAFA